MISKKHSSKPCFCPDPKWIQRVRMLVSIKALCAGPQSGVLFLILELKYPSGHLGTWGTKVLKITYETFGLIRPLLITSAEQCAAKRCKVTKRGPKGSSPWHSVQFMYKMYLHNKFHSCVWCVYFFVRLLFFFCCLCCCNTVNLPTMGRLRVFHNLNQIGMMH